MPTERHPRVGLRNALALFVLLATIALFATAALAAAPAKLPPPAPAAGAGTPSPTPTGCIRVWNVVDSPNPYTNGYNDLTGVDAIASNDVWAVGSGQVQHWDGSMWTAITNTLPMTSATVLRSVSATSANDVWAVGRGPAAGYNTGVILHWDGSSWSNIPNPDPQEETGLFGVAAISANDAWAVGYRGDFNQSNALALHWDGSAWSIVPTPPPPSGTYFLTAVSALATNNVWAVGYTASGALMMHWDGVAWSVSPASLAVPLYGVVALSDNDVWASGTYWDGSAWSGAIVHWDGTSWSLSTSGHGDILPGMAATSSSDVWAVGRASNGTLVMHWDGSAWSTVNSPRPFPFAGELWGVSAISPTEVWAAGDASFGGQDTTLTIRYTQWCPTPVQCSTGWNVINVANPSPDINAIYGIDGDSAADIWAVGVFALADGGTYAQRWNGSYWLPVSIPVVPALTRLSGVKVLSSNDVWAVGWDDESTRGSQDYGALATSRRRGIPSPGSPGTYYSTVALHWDGQAWTRVPSPSPGTTYGSWLTAIVGVSASNLWAVGSYQDSNGYETLVLHWDGNAWSQVASPAGTLLGVEAIAPNNVWAVGDSGPYSTSTTLILHWDGSQWSSVPSPSPGTDENTLYAISAISADDIWAVGDYHDTNGFHALTLHWNGSQWSTITAPGSENLEGVSANSSNDVWAVGLSNDSGQGAIVHWDGSAWTIVQHPNPDPNQPSEFYSVLAVSANEVWSVGTAGQYYLHSLIERYVGSCATPSPTATQTPIPTPSLTPSPIPTGCERTWLVPISPNPGSTNELIGLDATSSNDVWAVGDILTATHRYPLIEHWSGNAWDVITTTDVLTDSLLYGVAALTPNNAWAVGYGSSNGAPRALIVHWDGSQWHSVANPGQVNGYALLGMSAISAKDIWAVGTKSIPNQPLAMHWDGATWTIVPVAGAASLDKVAAVSTNDVWAIGEGGNGTVMMHWDGTQWTLEPGSFSGLPYGITAVSSSDVWAVSTDFTGPTWHAYILHWDGMQWSISSTDDNRNLIGITASSANDVWAVGGTGAGTFVKHWDGTSWSIVPGPSPDPPQGAFYNAVAISPGELWAVGTQNNENDTLTARYAYGPCPTPTVPPTTSPTATGQVVATSTPSSTATRTAATSTPAATITATASAIATSTPTPTVCTLQFEDVPPSNTFYPGVHCLACLGIVNGYPCGGPGEPCNGNNDPYFRPNNSVTRGQLAKIVSQAAGFSGAVTGQTFADVPPGSTFYTYTERLEEHGVMSGYPCGGPGEPCDPQHRPYFRPNNSATRGQLTKIVSNAAGFNDSPPPDTQTFADVPPGSTFYLYVERLLINRPGVMSGYPCGGPYEPCDPQHRPYFRPNNTLTRGQTAKIAANTFFPSCSP